MNNFNNVIDMLKKKKNSFKGDYFIPTEWNYLGYDKYIPCSEKTDQINVNPYDFMIFCIEKAFIKNTATTDPTDMNLCSSIVYSMMPRMFSAWHHYADMKPCSGTLLKAIILLPFLKQFGVSIIYLLPVFKYSSMYRKGELGCPYAIKDIYKLDEGLHDPLLGEYNEQILELEFKAFVEACHILDIKVMIDFVFRTVARDSLLIAEHPNWFYWIDLKYKDTFNAPRIESIKNPTPVVNARILKSLYNSGGARECMEMFRQSPDVINKERWLEVKKKYDTFGGNILDLIEEEFNITTVPGFSDVINDNQPAWSDVTYLKYYRTANKKIRKFISGDQADYILQDGVKSSIYPGEEINKPLWEYISGTIPYYQNKFNIDGARIDMGHALPPELNKEIICRAKEVNNNFILWSEEFNEKNSQKAQEDGFHFITSTIWNINKDYDKSNYVKKLYVILLNSAIPVTGALEMADTPRSALRFSPKILEQLIFINFFIPNAVPLINNGQELMEIQPMNLGLDNTEEGRYVLDKSDLMYGKLAFFDNYVMHWTNEKRRYIIEKFIIGFKIRSSFIDLISRKELLIRPDMKKLSAKTIFIGYHNDETGKNVLLIANRSAKRRAKVLLRDMLPDSMRDKLKNIKIIYRNTEAKNIQYNINKVIDLEPEEIIIACVE